MIRSQTIYDVKGNPVFAIILWQTFQLVSTLISDISLSDEEIYDSAKRSEEESLPIEVANRLLAGGERCESFSQLSRFNPEAVSPESWNSSRLCFSN